MFCGLCSLRGLGCPYEGFYRVHPASINASTGLHQASMLPLIKAYIGLHQASIMGSGLTLMVQGLGFTGGVSKPVK